MKCKICKGELVKVPVLGSTNKFFYYCPTCYNNGKQLGECMSNTTFHEKAWRTGLNGHKKGVQV